MRERIRVIGCVLEQNEGESIRVIGCVLEQNGGEYQSHRLCVGTEWGRGSES